jgi:hypothetical protein
MRHHLHPEQHERLRCASWLGAHRDKVEELVLGDVEALEEVVALERVVRDRREHVAAHERRDAEDVKRLPRLDRGEHLLDLQRGAGRVRALACGRWRAGRDEQAAVGQARFT